MMENEKISATQMGIMAYASIVTTGVLYLPATTFRYAGKDLWLSPIWSSIIGFIMIFVICQLNKYYPKETIMQYSCSILGKVLGKIVGIIFILIGVLISNQVLWQYGDFVSGYFLPLTPQVVILGSMALMCAFAVRGGLEVMGRLSNLIVPLLIIMFVTIIILLLPSIKLNNILPILGNGIVPTIKGSIFSNLWFSEYILLAFIFPQLNDAKSAKKWGLISVFMLVITLTLMNLITMLTFGTATGNFFAPLMNVVQYISIAGFLSHLEVIVMAVWIAGAFLKIFVLFYVITIGTAQWLNLSDYRPIVLPIAFLIVALAIWQVPNLSAWNIYMLTMNVGLMLGNFLFPLFLLLVAFIKQRRMRKRGKQLG